MQSLAGSLLYGKTHYEPTTFQENQKERMDIRMGSDGSTQNSKATSFKSILFQSHKPSPNDLCVYTKSQLHGWHSPLVSLLSCLKPFLFPPGIKILILPIIYQVQTYLGPHSTLFLACQPFWPLSVLQMYHAASNHRTFACVILLFEMPYSL